MKEKKDRVDDALHATRAAVQEGIIPGGGVAYVRAIAALGNVKVDNEDQATGVNIIRLALEAPLRTIVENAGQEGSVIVAKVKEGKDDFGFDARDNKYVNFFAAGIIDPTKVARLALENAASIAGLLLTTEAVVSEIPEEKEAAAMPHGGGMGGMM
jgi:chaperonin GroEL